MKLHDKCPDKVFSVGSWQIQSIRINGCCPIGQYYITFLNMIGRFPKMNERLHDMTQSRDVISQENKKIKKDTADI